MRFMVQDAYIMPYFSPKIICTQCSCKQYYGINFSRMGELQKDPFNRDSTSCFQVVDF